MARRPSLGAVVEEQLIVLRRVLVRVQDEAARPKASVHTRELCNRLATDLESVISALAPQVKGPNRRFVQGLARLSLASLQLVPAMTEGTAAGVAQAVVARALTGDTAGEARSEAIEALTLIVESCQREPDKWFHIQVQLTGASGERAAAVLTAEIDEDLRGLPDITDGVDIKLRMSDTDAERVERELRSAGAAFSIAPTAEPRDWTDWPLVTPWNPSAGPSVRAMQSEQRPRL